MRLRHCQAGGVAERFDVVIVGARCAGAPLAATLARRGLRVCLLDRARFPSDTLSTHVIQPCGVAILDRLGVLDAVHRAGAVPLNRLTLVADDTRIDAEASVAVFGAAPLCVRRVALDHLLVSTAATAGAHVRTGTGVSALVYENGRVAGVETAAGTIRAPLVVGADGRGSSVAGWVGAREYHVAPPGRMFSWAYFQGVDPAEDRLLMGWLGELAFVASPTDSGLYMAAVGSSIDEKDTFLADREGNYLAALAAWPELAGLLADAGRLGPIRVMANWHGYFREAAGPGWALVGDAGHFKDPSPAQGMSDALRQADRLASAVERGLGGGADPDRELRRWWSWRDDDAYEMHWLATDIGEAGARPLLTNQVIRDIAGDQEATEDLLRVLNHDIRPSEFLGLRRVGAAAARAARGRPNQIPLLTREAARAVGNRVRRRRRHPYAALRGRAEGQEAAAYS